MTTSHGTSRIRRQIPSSVPLTTGLWLVSMTNVCDGSKLPEVLAHPAGLEPVAAGEPLDGALGQAPALVGLVQHGQPQAEQVGGAGRVRVERPGGQQLGVGGVGVVAERGQRPRR